MRRARLRAGQETGAAAVEFALVVPLLLALVLGIIDYGLWFNDSLNLRQGVREGARAGSLANYGSDSSCGASGGSPETRKLVCLTVAETASVGTGYARVVPPADWKLGSTLLVCGIVEADGVTGFTPLPKDGLIRTKIKTTVEVDAPAPSGSSPATTGPSLDWGWCS